MFQVPVQVFLLSSAGSCNVRLNLKNKENENQYLVFVLTLAMKEKLSHPQESLAFPLLTLNT